MFVFENVLGLQTAKRGEPFADLKRLVEELAPESNFHAKFGLHKIIVHFATKRILIKNMYRYVRM